VRIWKWVFVNLCTYLRNNSDRGIRRRFSTTCGWSALCRSACLLAVGMRPQIYVLLPVTSQQDILLANRTQFSALCYECGSYDGSVPRAMPIHHKLKWLPAVFRKYEHTWDIRSSNSCDVEKIEISGMSSYHPETKFQCPHTLLISWIFYIAVHEPISDLLQAFFRMSSVPDRPPVRLRTDGANRSLKSSAYVWKYFELYIRRSHPVSWLKM
jgi:hypothetical protein